MKHFYRCNLCGNLVGLIKKGGGTLVCCGQNMQGLVPGESDASVEKHMPVVTVTDNKVSVQVGATMHPMTPEHFIEFIYIETTKGGKRAALKPTDSPTACFCLCKDEKLLGVYAYCNLHSLFMKLS